jgi:hypothetical protein
MKKVKSLADFGTEIQPKAGPERRQPKEMKPRVRTSITLDKPIHDKLWLLARSMNMSKINALLEEAASDLLRKYGVA